MIILNVKIQKWKIHCITCIKFLSKIFKTSHHALQNWKHPTGSAKIENSDLFLLKKVISNAPREPILPFLLNKENIEYSYTPGGKLNSPITEQVAYLCDHFAAGLVTFPMIGLLLELLKNAFARRSVLEGKFGHDAAELVGLGVLNAMQRYAQPQDELVEAVEDAPVHDAQDDYALSAFLQELRHPGNEEGRE